MTEQNKYTLTLANEAMERGDYETFLSLCTDDTCWTFIGERTLVGKEEVRSYFREAYRKPPIFDVSNLVAEGNQVIAVGNIRLLDGSGSERSYAYCDVWELKGGKLHTLQAYVIEKSTSGT